MSEDTDTTTIEVSDEVWSGLDKRKERGESFDDVIRRLFGQADVPLGGIQVDDAIEIVDVREAKNAPAGASCSHYKPIEGEICGEPAEYIEVLRYDDGEEQEFYFCEDHVAEIPEDD